LAGHVIDFGEDDNEGNESGSQQKVGKSTRSKKPKSRGQRVKSKAIVIDEDEEEGGAAFAGDIEMGGTSSSGISSGKFIFHFKSSDNLTQCFSIR
jgi:hypothetical protein